MILKKDLNSLLFRSPKSKNSAFIDVLKSYEKNILNNHIFLHFVFVKFVCEFSIFAWSIRLHDLFSCFFVWNEYSKPLIY